jgi:hypothetical protein
MGQDRRGILVGRHTKFLGRCLAHFLSIHALDDGEKGIDTLYIDKIPRVDRQKKDYIDLGGFMEEGFNNHASPLDSRAYCSLESVWAIGGTLLKGMLLHKTPLWRHAPQGVFDAQTVLPPI